MAQPTTTAPTATNPTATNLPPPGLPNIPVPVFNYIPTPPVQIFNDYNRLLHNIQTYLHETIPGGTRALAQEENHPTPEGLALSMGFAGFSQLKNYVKKTLNLPEGEEREKALPQTSFNLVMASFATLQDYYLKHSLSTKISATVSKFIASAYFNTNETKVSDSTTRSEEDRTIRVIIEGATASTIEEQNEMIRLNQHLERQTKSELAALGDRDILRAEDEEDEEDKKNKEETPSPTLEDIL